MRIKKENSAEKSGAQISGEQEELWKVTPDQVIYLRKKTATVRIYPHSGHHPHRGTGYHGLPGSSHRAEVWKKVQLLCPLEITEGLLRQEDEVIRGEEAMEEKLKTARIIVADPLYRPICPESATFYEMPHIAFSGRIYLKKFV